MKVIEITEASSILAEYAATLTEEPVILMSEGQPIAALVTLENVDMETISLSMNPKFMTLVERSRAQRRSEGGISSSEMRRRLGLSEA
jgi:pyridoxine 5'-phosphate synthase PdxJ